MKLHNQLALLVFAAAGATAAWSQTPPEVTSQETQVTFSSRVNLVSVPVVVRDREGRAVGNLTQDDFQLFDKGKLQVISKFSVEKTEKTASVPGASSGALDAPSKPQPVLPNRYVAYLFDDVHLERGNLLDIRRAVNRHLDQALDASGRAAIMTTTGLALADFTGDREKLHKAVDSVQPWTSGIEALDCPPVTYYTADLLTNKFLYMSLSAEQILDVIMKGQADESLVATYGATKRCYPKVPNSVIVATMKANVGAALNFGDQETRYSLGAVKDTIHRLSVMPGNRILVLVSPGFLLTRDFRFAENDLFESAARANVRVNVIDARGLCVFCRTEDSNILAELADGTGGKYFHDDNGLVEGLNEVAAAPEYMYILGFSPHELKFDGAYHNLKVTVRKPAGASLQVRRGYWAPNHAVDSSETAKEEIEEAFFSSDEIRDIPVDIQTEFFKSTDEKAELTVVARVRADGLHFRKAEDRNNDTVTVVAGLFDGNGNYVSGVQRIVTMRLRDQTLASLQSSGMQVKESFHVSPGRYVVRVVVRDTEGKAIAARNAGVEIP
jgi:VWFA-related protein